MASSMIAPPATHTQFPTYTTSHMMQGQTMAPHDAQQKYQNTGEAMSTSSFARIPATQQPPNYYTPQAPMTAATHTMHTTHTTTTGMTQGGTTYGGSMTKTSRDTTLTYRPPNAEYVPPGKNLSNGMYATYDMRAVPTFEAPLLMHREEQRGLSYDLNTRGNLGGSSSRSMSAASGLDGVKSKHRKVPSVGGPFEKSNKKNTRWCC